MRRGQGVLEWVAFSRSSYQLTHIAVPQRVPYPTTHKHINYDYHAALVIVQDTDDGSSFYNISDNFFFMADAWKMDYGGHDFAVTNNVVYHGHNDGQNCFNTWPFLPGHGAVYEDNVCILPKSTNLGNPSSCTCPGPTYNPNTPSWFPGARGPSSECGVAFTGNRYYTENGTATINCHRPRDGFPFQAWQQGGADAGSTVKGLPSDDELLAWARSKLDGM